MERSEIGIGCYTRHANSLIKYILICVAGIVPDKATIASEILRKGDTMASTDWQKHNSKSVTAIVKIHLSDEGRQYYNHTNQNIDKDLSQDRKSVV